MSDDVMKGLKDLLRTETTDPPPDVTSPVPRPGRGRGLSALTETAPVPAPATPEDAVPDPTVLRPSRPRPTTAPTSPTGTPTATPPPITPASTPLTEPRTIDVAPTPRRKTSVTLPPTVRDRVADAYHHGRWTLLALLELAGERLASAAITRADVEDVVAALNDGGGSASIRSLSVPSALLDQFDELSTSWRLSRSALIAACLVLVLDQLPN